VVVISAVFGALNEPTTEFVSRSTTNAVTEPEPTSTAR